MKNKGKGKYDKGKIAVAITTMCLCLFIANFTVSFFKYPEQYMTTWKYQLEKDLRNGDEKAIEYYNSRYVSNGKYLFGDKYIEGNEDCVLNLSTVVDVEISESGLMLITDGGDGYYLEGDYLNS